MKKIIALLVLGLVGTGVLVVHQAIRIKEIIEDSRHSSLTIKWNGEGKSYGISSPSIGSDGVVIGGVKIKSIGNDSMMIELVINKMVTVGITKNGDIIECHSIKPGDNITINVN